MVINNSAGRPPSVARAATTLSDSENHVQWIPPARIRPLHGEGSTWEALHHCIGHRPFRLRPPAAGTNSSLPAIPEISPRFPELRLVFSKLLVISPMNRASSNVPPRRHSPAATAELRGHAPVLPCPVQQPSTVELHGHEGVASLMCASTRTLKSHAPLRHPATYRACSAL